MPTVRELSDQLRTYDLDAEVRTADDLPVFLAEKNDKVYITDVPPKKPAGLFLVVARLLRYSFGPIDYDFNGLTKEEKRIIETPEMLNKLTHFIRTQERLGSRP